MGLEDCMEVNVFHMRTQERESNYQWAEVAYFLLNLHCKKKQQNKNKNKNPKNLNSQLRLTLPWIHSQAAHALNFEHFWRHLYGL